MCIFELKCISQSIALVQTKSHCQKYRDKYLGSTLHADRFVFCVIALHLPSHDLVIHQFGFLKCITEYARTLEICCKVTIGKWPFFNSFEQDFYIRWRDQSDESPWQIIPERPQNLKHMLFMLLKDRPWWWNPAHVGAKVIGSDHYWNELQSRCIPINTSLAEKILKQ